MIWITRPSIDAQRMASSLEKHGLASVNFSLLEVVFQKFDPDAFPNIKGLIATSRNGLKGAAAQALPQGWFDLPLFAVGGATGDLATTLGFRDVRVPSSGTSGGVGAVGGAAALVPLIKQAGIKEAGFTSKALLHFRGDEVSFDLKGALGGVGIELLDVLTYRILEVAQISSEFQAILKEGAAHSSRRSVVLMSARTARIYASLMKKTGLDDVMAGMVHYCLSAQIAETLAQFDLEHVKISEFATQQAMIELLLADHAPPN